MEEVAKGQDFICGLRRDGRQEQSSDWKKLHGKGITQVEGGGVDGRVPGSVMPSVERLGAVFSLVPTTLCRAAPRLEWRRGAWTQACWSRWRRRWPAVLGPLGGRVNRLGSDAPVLLDDGVRQGLAAAASREGHPSHPMESSAGHDVAIVAGSVPSGMIFIPSLDGLSHCPLEWSAPEHLEVCLRVLYRACLDLSQHSITSPELPYSGS